MSKDNVKVNETYQVTARKWRPKDFSELKGQEHISKTLSHIIDSGKIAHAYLFSGPRGVGKTTTARILAKCLNCVEGPTMSPCGKCDNCKEIASGISPDVYEIDGASNRGVDRIRELRENVRYLPSKSGYKIYIIDEVHMLTTEAFNALLKTLEEPPEHVIFIFATTEPHKVKITIRSRCQHFLFKRMNLETLMEQIKLILNSYEIAYDNESIEAIARSADGSMRDSQSIMDQVIAFCGDNISIEETRKVLGVSGNEKYYDFIKFLINKDIHGLMTFTNDLVFGGTDLGNFSIGLMEMFRNLTIVKGLPNESTAVLDISSEDVNELKDLAKTFDLYQLREITRRSIDLNRDIRNTSNQRFLFESYIFNIIDYENFVSFADVIKRIESIEKELANIDDVEIDIEETKLHKIITDKNDIKNKTTEVKQQQNINPPKETSTTKVPASNIKADNEDKSTDADSDLKEQKSMTMRGATKTKIPANYVTLIAEDLRNRGLIFTSNAFVKAQKTEVNEDQRKLMLYYDDKFSVDRCKRDVESIESSCYNVFKMPYKIDVRLIEKQEYTNEEYLKTKENIKEVFNGEDV